MPDAFTAGVLRDLSIYVSIATVLALAGYWMMRRHRPGIAWNNEGQALSSPYAAPDLLLLAGLGLFFILAIQPHQSAATTDSAGISAGGLVASMVLNLLMCAALLVYLHRIRGLNPAELFGLQHIHWRTLVLVVLVFTVIILISVNLVSAATLKWLESFWPDQHPQETVRAFQESGSLGFRFLVIIAAAVTAPLAEEIFFRGFVYGVLKRYTDAPFAALASSLMFAVIHMHVGSLLPLCMLAVLFCLAYEITGCLLAPMLLHAVFNSASVIGMMIFDAGG
jgi:membrane protease YdiL (CAAX protease family)